MTSFGENGTSERPRNGSQVNHEKMATLRLHLVPNAMNTLFLGTILVLGR